MKRIILLIAFASAFFSLNAQKTWTLEQCIDYALEHNIQVKQSLLNVDMYEANLLQSKLDLVPTFNAGATHGYNWGQTIDLYTNEFATDRVQSNNFYASTGVTLFSGFQKINTIKKYQIDLLKSRYDADQFMDDVSLNIAIAYLQVLYYREMVAVANVRLDVTMQQVSRTEKLVEAGTLARGDLLTIEAQAANEELQLTNTVNSLDLSVLTLAQLLDLPEVNDFVVAEPKLLLKEEMPTAQSVESIYATALETRADVKSSELAVESSMKSLAIAKGMQTPSLSLSGNWGTGYSGAARQVSSVSDPYLSDMPFGATANGVPIYNYTADATYATKPFSDQLKDNNNQTLTAYLNIPIFNGWRTRSAICNAKINVENSQLTLQTTKLNLRKTIQQAYADATASLKTYYSAEKTQTASDEAFQYAQEKFNLGLINSFEYNTAKKDRDMSQSEMVQAKFDFIFKSVILEFYMGNPITLKQWQ